MTEFDPSTLRTGVQNLTNSDDSDDDTSEQWAVVVQSPEEYSDSAREAAKRLFSSVHGHGTISFEIHSDGETVEIHLVTGDRETAEMVARHVRTEIDGHADVREASVPINDDDAIASAEFQYERDLIFPLATPMTDDGEVGPLHHVLDTMAEDEVAGIYQVVAEPVEQWTARRSRALPESIEDEDERDIEEEMKRAGMAMVPVIAVSAMISPWPLETSLVVGLALLTAATVGEGVRIPQVRTGEELAHEHRERTKDAHGASSSQGKQAATTAETITDEAQSPGWRLSVRVAVDGDKHRNRLATQIKRAYASDVTGQKLTVTTVEDDALARLRDRRVTRQPREYLHQFLGHGTRREMRAGSGELASLGYFAGRDGGGSDAREFVAETEIESLSVLDAAPSYSRPQAVADGGSTKPDYLLDPDRTETRLHPEYAEVETKVAEAVVDDDDDYYAGEFARELVETSQQNSHYWLGYVEDGEQIRELGISADQLRQHIFIGGASGAGKSTLAEALLMQHSWADRGFAALDPHDALVDSLLEMLPEHRKDDVIVFDPSDTTSEYTHTLNFLDVEVSRDHPDWGSAVNGAVDDTVGVLCQGASNIGDRMEDTLYGLVRGMIQSQKDYTFLDMREILRNEDRQQQFADRMYEEGYGYLAEFGEDLVEMSPDDISPVTRLLNKWVLDPTAREIISHVESTINFREIIEGDKILLLRGKIDNDELQQLVSTAILKKLYRAAKQRSRGDRSTYPILVDETDDIYTPEMSLDSMLGNARKYGVSLTLMTQKPSNLSEIRDDIETNCKTFISYTNPATTESRAISKMFDCDPSDIAKIGDYRALIQLDLDGSRAGPFTTEMLAPIPAVRTEDEAEQEIVIPSRRDNGIKRDDSAEISDEDDDDQDDEDSQQEKMDEFVRTVAHAAADDDLEEDEQFKFVRKGKPNESLRINPSRVVEALDDPSLDAPEEYTALSGDLVDDETSYITGHRKRSPPVGRCLGLDLNAAIAPLSDVTRGMFE